MAGLKDPMFNISTSIEALFQAEKIANSTLLSAEDKVSVLTALKEGIVVDMEYTPEHARVASRSISRLIETYAARADAPRGQTQKQGRKTKGIEDKASLDTGGPEESPQEAAREAEGVETRPEDTGSPDRAEPGAKA